MITLQKKVQTLYRFRCAYCKSQFEMTEEEKTENDWKHHEGNRPRGESLFPCNPNDHFDCPVCKKVSMVMKRDMHKFAVMDDGSEISYY